MASREKLGSSSGVVWERLKKLERSSVEAQERASGEARVFGTSRQA